MSLDTFVEDCQRIIRERKAREVQEFFQQELIKAMALLPEIDDAGELEELLEESRLGYLTLGPN